MAETLERPVRYPKYPGEYFEKRADELFEQSIKAQVANMDPDLDLVIDIESGEFAVGNDHLEVAERLIAKNPNGQLYHRHVGYNWSVQIRGRIKVIPKYDDEDVVITSASNSSGDKRHE